MKTPVQCLHYNHLSEDEDHILPSVLCCGSCFGKISSCDGLFPFEQKEPGAMPLVYEKTPGLWVRSNESGLYELMVEEDGLNEDIVGLGTGESTLGITKGITISALDGQVMGNPSWMLFDAGVRGLDGVDVKTSG